MGFSYPNPPTGCSFSDQSRSLWYPWSPEKWGMLPWHLTLYSKCQSPNQVTRKKLLNACLSTQLWKSFLDLPKLLKLLRDYYMGQTSLEPEIWDYTGKPVPLCATWDFSLLPFCLVFLKVTLCNLGGTCFTDHAFASWVLGLSSWVTKPGSVVLVTIHFTTKYMLHTSASSPPQMKCLNWTPSRGIWLPQFTTCCQHLDLWGIETKPDNLTPFSSQLP